MTTSADRQPFSQRNHYVPRWLQRRFITPEQKEQVLYYLDLDPPRIGRADGGYYYRNDLRILGTKECFKDDHLYTLFLGGDISDVIEKEFFGILDDRGARAVELFSEYTLNDRTKAALHDLLRFMDAQKFRTPKGLDLLKLLAERAGIREPTNLHNQTLALMRQLWQSNMTIWMEGVWEVLRCDNSPTKFIVSDHPVCTYNKALFPASPECRYPFDARIERVGTHTIFPLGLSRCLVITNLEYVRNPKASPVRVRQNPRYFKTTLFDLRKVQTGRQISEQQVLAINYVLKKRARRYVASTVKEWLYPERHLDTDMWNKLGGRWFLMPDPRKVRFTTQILIGHADGSAWGQDEYGRRPNDDDPRIRAKRNLEFAAHEAVKKAWDTVFGPLSREELDKDF